MANEWEQSGPTPGWIDFGPRTGFDGFPGDDVYPSEDLFPSEGD